MEEGRSANDSSSSCPCGNTYTYTMSIGEQSGMDSKDELKVAVKAVMEEIAQQEMEVLAYRIINAILNETIDNTHYDETKEREGHLTTKLNSQTTELKDCLAANCCSCGPGCFTFKGKMSSLNSSLP